MWQIENWAVISICHSLYWREDMLKTKMCRGQATTKFGYDLYAINPIILVSLIKSKKEMKHITQHKKNIRITIQQFSSNIVKLLNSFAGTHF